MTTQNLTDKKGIRGYTDEVVRDAQNISKKYGRKRLTNFLETATLHLSLQYPKRISIKIKDRIENKY